MQLNWTTTFRQVCTENGTGGFSPACEELGECSTIQSPPAFFFFLKIRSRTLIPLFMSGSVHSDSVSWDDCGCMWARFRRWKYFCIQQMILHYLIPEGNSKKKKKKEKKKKRRRWWWWNGSGRVLMTGDQDCWWYLKHVTASALCSTMLLVQYVDRPASPLCGWCFHISQSMYTFLEIQLSNEHQKDQMVHCVCV